MNSGQPIFILPEGTIRNSGKDAILRNIGAAKAVADSVRTTLGPKGMDKMLVDSIGDITITNDGVTILNDMEVEHPAAKMMVEVAKTQENEVGDGTTTAVVISGELLKKAEGLLEQEIHPTVIIKGFRMAKEKSIEILKEVSTNLILEDTELLEKIAMTSMTGKGSETAKDSLAKLAVDAVKTIASKDGNELKIDKENIQIEKKQGASIEESELIKGIVLDKEIVHPRMQKKVTEAKIALIDSALEVKETERTAEINVNTPEQLQAFIEQEHKMLKDMVEKIKESGSNVVFCQKGIDDIAQHYLSKNNIIAARRVKKSDMEKLSKSTGANIVSRVEDITIEDLGYAGIVEEKKIAGEEMIFVRECRDPRAVSILVRGTTEHVVEESKRAMDDAVLGIISGLEKGKVVFGGGAIEIEISKRLKEYADSVGGREQLAITSFGEAIESIPRTLAESTGKDPIDILVELRTQHENGNPNAGVDVLNGNVTDMKQTGVVEPMKIKTHAINSASEAAIMILRIDDVITSKGGGMPQGPPPGMEGMM